MTAGPCGGGVASSLTTCVAGEAGRGAGDAAACPPAPPPGSTLLVLPATLSPGAKTIPSTASPRARGATTWLAWYDATTRMTAATERPAMTYGAGRHHGRTTTRPPACGARSDSGAGATRPAPGSRDRPRCRAASAWHEGQVARCA